MDGRCRESKFAVADINLIGGKRAILVDSITGGDIHTFVRQIVIWRVPDDKHSRTYSYVAFFPAGAGAKAPWPLPLDPALAPSTILPDPPLP